ncbi:MAG: ATP-binding protein, partial [Bdellovibrionota bacterium]
RWQQHQFLAQEDLSIAKDRLELVLASSNIGIWEIDLSTGIVNRSEQHDRLYGYAETLPAWTWDLFMNAIYPDDREGVREHIDRVGRSAESFYSGEFRIVWPDGSIHWVASRARFIRNAGGRATHVRGILWDVTDLKVAQEEAEEAARAKSQFLANVSHELRTPLGAILGFQRMLKDPSLSEADRTNYNEIVERNGQALLRLIDDVLDLSRVEAGALGIEVSSIVLTSAMTDLVHAFEPQLGTTGNSLDIRYEDDLPRAFVSDPHRLRQILNNLVSNAIKFTERGKIQLVIKPAGERLQFDVVDTGAGIDLAVQNELFKAFRQGDETITRRYGGTGLGLALSRELAQALGGDLSLVDSAPGKGSRFRLELPLVEDISVAPLEARPKPATHRPRALNGYRILVVDDSADNQLLMKRALQRVGAVVEHANNGLEGVDSALSEDFDLVLMDMQMPVMDGETATRYLRTAGYSRPIFALTAHAMKEQRENCLKMGCTEHVSKPVDFGALVDLILKHVPVRTAASSPDEISRNSRTKSNDSSPSF